VNIRVNLNDKEAKDWQAAGAGRDLLLERVRDLAKGDDVDRVEVYAGALHLVELAPSSHGKLAARLRQMALHRVADMVDPTINGDDVERSKVADEITNLGRAFSERDIPETPPQ
jgi:hypothetical protein